MGERTTSSVLFLIISKPIKSEKKKNAFKRYNVHDIINFE